MESRIHALEVTGNEGGAGDHGADILVTVERSHPLTGRVDQTVCAVQVKSFAGEHGSTRAIEDIRRAFETHPNVSSGLIVPTPRGPVPTLHICADGAFCTSFEVNMLVCIVKYALAAVQDAPPPVVTLTRP